jgi:hypothetical protein
MPSMYSTLSQPYAMPKREYQVNFRVSAEGKAILYALQDHYGLSQAGVFEMLLRQVARDQGIDTKKPGRSITSTLGSGKGGRHG